VSPENVAVPLEAALVALVSVPPVETEAVIVEVFVVTMLFAESRTVITGWVVITAAAPAPAA
jgi:hypothetical protein